MNKNKKKNPKASSLNALSPKALEQSAASYYEATDYKNALPRYERIYRKTPNDSNKDRLINCLLHRAKRLREKNMYLGASALLGNLHKLSPTSLPIQDYLECLLKILRVTH